MDSSSRKNSWKWIPSLYFAEGIPYVVVMLVSVIMYKRLGISNTEIALYTSWLYLPWVIKPLWSPFIDLFKTKRWWIVTMQLLIGAGLGGVALTIPMSNFFVYSLAFMWLLAFSSATHDIAADGFYMLGLNDNDQAWFVGVRSTFYRLAMITGQGLLIIFAGYIESHTGLPTVEMKVSSSTTQEWTLPQHPDSLNLPTSNEEKILTYPELISIPVGSMSRSQSDSLLTFARNWNMEQGFVDNEITTKEEQVSTSSSIQEESGLFDRIIRLPLESLIVSIAGKEVAELSPKAGNLSYAYFTLASPPKDGETVVVNLGRDFGDKSIQLVEGFRFEFTEANWNTPAIAVFQLDHKLKQVSTAGFSGTAGNIPLAWSITFFLLSGMFVAFFIYHNIVLPKPVEDKAATSESSGNILGEFLNTFILFFKKKNIGIILGFLLLYRFAEAQLVKLASPFLLDASEVGGLALTTGEVGFVYGTVGVISLTLGGLVGGFLAARNGLKFWLWPMVLMMNAPNAVYVYLSHALPTELWIVNVCVAIEQFGYGFGFTAYMLYMIYVSQGEHKTAHFAITTGFMALGMMIPGMFSGWIQELVGYDNFFIWVIIATIPAFLVTKFVPIDAEFGKKSDENE